MNNQNNKVEITYGSSSLKEICNEILKREFIKLLGEERGKK